jgi:predicted Ser/Thr protein kinase
MDEEEMGGTQPDKERRKYVYREIEPTDLTLGDILGVGAFGKVYQGCWRGGPVAVKVFDTVKLSEANDDVIDEIRKEAEMMEKLGMNPSALAVFTKQHQNLKEFFFFLKCVQATIRQ